MSKRLNAHKAESSSPFKDLIQAYNTPQTPIAVPVPDGRPPTRAKGKSASDDYVKLTSYIRRETHREIKRKLLDDGREISELIEDLLGQWLRKDGVGN